VPTEFLTCTHGVCAACRMLVPAKIVTDGRDVRMRRFCLEHGESESILRGDVEGYLRAQRVVKPAWIPRRFDGRSDVPCPEGCGFCDRHEQHLCMPIVEITNRCDLVCPVCINSSGGAGVTPADLSVPDFERMLDRILDAEIQVDVLNLSGGEPLLHPELLSLIDAALARKGIVRVSVSTNGLRLLREPGLLAELKRRDVVVSLQFDGFSDEAYRVLRGRPLAEEKREILKRLQDADLTMSLTMTVAGGVNDGEIPAVLAAFMESPHVVSLMLQPLAFAGRGAALKGRSIRIGIPEVVDQLAGAGVPPVGRDDFVPLPCSHPLCYSLAFYLVLEDGRRISVGRLLDAPALLDVMSNRVVFGLDAAEHERMKAMVYDLWSGPAGAVPEGESVIKTLKGILGQLTQVSGCSCFDPRRVFGLAERRVKSIFIHAFQDAETFDLARVRRCCQAYPQPDGRLLPACVRNVMGSALGIFTNHGGTEITEKGNAE
jgi:uncharacterized radical SAM superfamily Fe-S cluster-containing enzyme